jgi:hypothetical protein
MVELRGLEPLASCMPYNSSQWPDVAGSGSTSSFSRSMSPVMARDRRSLAPRLAPHWLFVTVSLTPGGSRHWTQPGTPSRSWNPGTAGQPPEVADRRSAWEMAQAALMSPMWLKAWGKLPSSSPVTGSTSSASRPTSLT